MWLIQSADDLIAQLKTITPLHSAINLSINSPNTLNKETPFYSSHFHSWHSHLLQPLRLTIRLLISRHLLQPVLHLAIVDHFQPSACWICFFLNVDLHIPVYVDLFFYFIALTFKTKWSMRIKLKEQVKFLLLLFRSPKFTYVAMLELRYNLCE